MSKRGSTAAGVEAAVAEYELTIQDREMISRDLVFFEGSLPKERFELSRSYKSHWKTRFFRLYFDRLEYGKWDKKGRLVLRKGSPIMLNHTMEVTESQIGTSGERDTSPGLSPRFIKLSVCKNPALLGAASGGGAAAATAASTGPATEATAGAATEGSLAGSSASGATAGSGAVGTGAAAIESSSRPERPTKEWSLCVFRDDPDDKRRKGTKLLQHLRNVLKIHRALKLEGVRQQAMRGGLLLSGSMPLRLEIMFKERKT